MDPNSLSSSDDDVTGLRSGAGGEATVAGGGLCCAGGRSLELDLSVDSAEADDDDAAENGQPADDSRRA